MNRGNRQADIFRTDTDRRRFLGWLAELPERFRTEIHAVVEVARYLHLNPVVEVRFSGASRRDAPIGFPRFRHHVPRSLIDAPSPRGVGASSRDADPTPTQNRGLKPTTILVVSLRDPGIGLALVAGGW